MKTLLVDDNRLMLEGMQNLLEAQGIEVVGIALGGEQSIGLARTLKPDLVLMDIRMPGCNGLAATRAIKAEMPEVRIIVLTTSTEDDDLFEAIKSGASGYLLKSISTDELVQALHLAEQGIPPFSPGLAARILSEFSRIGNVKQPRTAQTAGETAEPASDGILNARQIQVLKLVADGLSYKEAGARLHLSPRTIKYHMAEIMDRLHLENRAQVLAYAGKAGLITHSTDD